MAYLLIVTQLLMTTSYLFTLQTMVEKLTFDYGFYVNYTASWMKSAQWLLWFTQLIVDAYKQGEGCLKDSY